MATDEAHAHQATNHKSPKSKLLAKFGLKKRRQQRRQIDDYWIGETLGMGGYSKVKAGYHVQSNHKVALKIMFADETGIISDSKKKQLNREIGVMEKVAHKNVIQLIKYDENALYPEGDGTKTKCILTVLEFAPRGELFDYLMFAPKNFSTELVRTYFYQFLQGLQAMHKQGFAHRDLKPENLLMDNKFNLKIADFGFAKQYKLEDGSIQLMKTTCGTKGYLAPELLKGQKYTYKCDLFAVGIIMFTTYAKFPPFQNANDTDWWWDKLSKGWIFRQSQHKKAQKLLEKKKKLQDRAHEQCVAASNGDKQKYQQLMQVEMQKIENYVSSNDPMKLDNKKMDLFWQAHERSMAFPDDFKNLMESLLNPFPAQRFDISDTFQHGWMKGDTLNEQGVVKEMSGLYKAAQKGRIKKIKDQMAELQKQQKQETLHEQQVLNEHKAKSTVKGDFTQIDPFMEHIESLSANDFANTVWSFPTNDSPSIFNLALVEAVKSLEWTMNTYPENNVTLIRIPVENEDSNGDLDVVVAVKQLLTNKLLSAELDSVDSKDENEDKDDNTLSNEELEKLEENLKQTWEIHFKRLKGDAFQFNKAIERLYMSSWMIFCNAYVNSDDKKDENDEDDQKEDGDDEYDNKYDNKYDNNAELNNIPIHPEIVA